MAPGDRERALRSELYAALEGLSAELDALELVGDIPVVEGFVEDFSQARIADARASGASWAEISEQLGVTRQAAHKRFSVRRERRRGTGAVIELRFVRKRGGS
jgi:hypothetical protein